MKKKRAVQKGNLEKMDRRLERDKRQKKKRKKKG